MILFQIIGMSVIVVLCLAGFVFIIGLATGEVTIKKE